MATVVFYFDFISPYSYVAFKLLETLKKPWELTIDFRPVRLHHIIKTSENFPPTSVPSRAAFLAKDLERTSKYYGIPFNPPENFLSILMRSAALLTTATQAMEIPSEKILEIVS